MKMGTLLFGGILGALAVVYANRNNRSMMEDLANAGQSMGGMVNKAKSRFSNMTMVSDNNDTNVAKRANKPDMDLSKVDKIVKNDQELKHTVNEILAENNQPTSSTRMH